MQERFSVNLTPIPTSARVARQRRTLRWRWATTIVSTVILAVILVWFRPDWPLGWLIAFCVLWVGASVFWLVLSLVGLSRAKRALARIHEGGAFHIDPEGLMFVTPEQVAVRWGDVDRIEVVGGRTGQGPRLAVEAGGERVVDIALGVLDVTPAVLDSMIRAFSLGKHHLDAHRLEASV